MKIKDLLTEAASKYTKAKFDKLMKDLKHVKREVEADGMNFDDSMAFELANNFLREEDGLEDYIRKNIGAKDVQGWLANQM